MTSCNCTRGLLSGDRIDHTGSAGGGARTGVGRGKGGMGKDNQVGHGTILPPTSAPQRELRGGTPLGPGTGSRARAGPMLDWVGPADSHWELPRIMLVMGQFYPRPVPRSVSCEAGPHFRLWHELAKPVRSADTFFDLIYLENFLDSRYFIHSNRKKTPQNGYLHTSISVN